MASLIEDFIATLTKQHDHYEELLILATEKVNIIKNDDVETLQKITAAETAILGKATKLENKREEIVKNIGVVLNRNADDLTLSSIAELINNEEDSKQLLELKDKLYNTLTQLKDKNEVNRAVIQTSLDYIDFSVNLLREGGADPLEGEMPSELRKNLFDVRQ